MSNKDIYYHYYYYYYNYYNYYKSKSKQTA